MINDLGKPDFQALVTDAGNWSYSELKTSVSDAKKVLALAGVGPGKVCCVLGDYDLSSISALYACIEIGAIILPYLNTQPVFVREQALKVAETDFIWEQGNITKLQTKIPEARNALLDNFRRKGTPGLILFSSGTSGTPKAALHDLTRLLKKFSEPSKAKRMINFLVFDHWGGLNTMFHILSSGGTLIATTNRSPQHICYLIEKWKIQVLPTSPSFLNLLLLSRAYELFDLSSLETITYGSEPMLLSSLKRANQVLPNIIFKQTYGLIELGVFKTKSESSSSLNISINSEDALTRVRNGKLEIKTESAMIGYLNASSPFTEDGWYKTGDMVELSGDYIRILGRDSDLINVGGEKVFPAEIESILLEMEGLLDCTVSKENHPLLGQIIVAHIVLSNPLSRNDALEKIRVFLSGRIAPAKIPSKVIVTQTSDLNTRFKKNRKIHGKR